MYEMKKVVRGILSAYEKRRGMRDCPLLDSFLPDELDKVDKIRRTKLSIEKELEDEKVKHKEKVKAINKQLSDLRSKCPHYSTTYYPDASGNNDSSRNCDICEVEL